MYVTDYSISSYLYAMKNQQILRLLHLIHQSSSVASDGWSFHQNIFFNKQLLNQVRAGRRPVHTWFLENDLVRGVCMCVRPQGYRAVAQTIILAAHKVTCGKKGQEKRIFQCYVVHGVGMLNFIENLK